MGVPENISPNCQILLSGKTVSVHGLTGIGAFIFLNKTKEWVSDQVLKAKNKSPLDECGGCTVCKPDAFCPSDSGEILAIMPSNN